MSEHAKDLGPGWYCEGGCSEYHLGPVPETMKVLDFEDFYPSDENRFLILEHPKGSPGYAAQIIGYVEKITQNDDVIFDGVVCPDEPGMIASREDITTYEHLWQCTDCDSYWEDEETAEGCCAASRDYQAERAERATIPRTIMLDNGHHGAQIQLLRGSPGIYSDAAADLLALHDKGILLTPELLGVINEQLAMIGQPVLS